MISPLDFSAVKTMKTKGASQIIATATRAIHEHD